MWAKELRDRVWDEFNRPFDIIVIGGGITGAGILREAARLGLRVLLLEGQDFAAGTSSRSSKLVHGGFRYLKNAQIKLTYESVHERERLLSEGRGLINRLGFLLTSYQGDRQPPWLFGLGLTFYDLLALKWNHQYYPAAGLSERCPPLNPDGLLGGYRYFDAQTDDARLVLRIIQEGVRDGGLALNYARVVDLLRRQNGPSAGEVCGVVVQDLATDGDQRTAEIQAGVVVNATGAWADELRTVVGGARRLRRLRGSHLVFTAHRLPLYRAVSMQHPVDGRFVFALPWEDVILIGTTDVDHDRPLSEEPAIGAQEVDYLMEFVRRAFPGQDLETKDILASFAGVRPVIGTGKTNPSDESREHVLWNENGLLTVTGGKLTTFRLMALDALRAACRRLPGHPKLRKGRVLDPVPFREVFRSTLSLAPAQRLRLLGRYGAETPALLQKIPPGELTPVPGSPVLWGELRWAARAEGIVHLDDLLLRRLRLGITLPGGGVRLLERIRSLVQAELGWDNNRWCAEADRYTRLWQQCYHIP